jgi:hypothetical protein
MRIRRSNSTLLLLVAAFVGCHAIQIPRVPGQRVGALARIKARLTFTTPRHSSPRPLEVGLPIEKTGSGINGDHPFQKLGEIDVATANDEEILPEAPPISYSKFLTMQEKRAVVTIRYSGDAGLKPYFLTMAKKLKASYPDVIIERRILPAVVDGEATFEVLVDGKVVIGKSRTRKAARGVEMQQGGRRSVFVSMEELDLAISRARRKHRPTTSYGDEDEPKKTKRSD